LVRNILLAEPYASAGFRTVLPFYTASVPVGLAVASGRTLRGRPRRELAVVESTLVVSEPDWPASATVADPLPFVVWRRVLAGAVRGVRACFGLVGRFAARNFVHPSASSPDISSYIGFPVS
jgi:hypothetical protein